MLSDYIVSLLKALQWFLITLVTYKTPRDVPLCISLTSLPITPPLIYYALTYLMFLSISKHAGSSIIALLFLLPGKFYLCIFAWLPPALAQASVEILFIVWPFLDKLTRLHPLPFPHHLPILPTPYSP